MVLRPIQRQSLSQSVYEQLRDEIVCGRLGSGSRLPSERELAQTLGVNRGAVREALKRLEQARLVSIQQGGAARVLEFIRSAGLDLLSEMLFAGGALDVQAARSVLEMRASLGPDIARQAAERTGPAAADRLDDVLERMEATEDLAARQVLVMEFWSILVESSQNVAYRLAFNSLGLAYGKFQHLLTQALEDELRSPEMFRTLADAVRARDGEQARARASALLALGGRRLLEVLDRLEALS